MATDRPSPQFKLRMPAPLKEWLQQRAKQNFRSANAEIVSRLEESRRREEPTERKPA